MSNKTPSGTYAVRDLLDDETQNLTIEQIITLIVSRIAEHDDCTVHVVNSDHIRVMEFDVHADDRRHVVGKQGRTIIALRTIAKAMLGPLNRKCNCLIGLAKDGFGEDEDTY